MGLEALKSPFSLDNVLVVPLNLGGFLKPAVQVFGLNLVRVRVKNGGILKLSAEHIQSRFFKVCAAPKHQANAAFLLAEADDRIAVQKPNGMTMPNLKICMWKAGEDA